MSRGYNVHNVAYYVKMNLHKKLHQSCTLDMRELKGAVTRPDADPEGGGIEDPDPPEKSQKYRVPFRTVPDPLKNHKATKLDSMLGYHRDASETPFKWRFAGGPMMARFKWYLDRLIN